MSLHWVFLLKGTRQILLGVMLLEVQKMVNGIWKFPASHCTGNQSESCAAQHLVPLKYGQGGLESFKAALLEHFMSTYVCCLRDRCSKGWGWTGADVMSLWNSTDCRNHPAGLNQELKVVLVTSQERINSTGRSQSLAGLLGSRDHTRAVLQWPWEEMVEMGGCFFSHLRFSEATLGTGQLAWF